MGGVCEEEREDTASNSEDCWISRRGTDWPQLSKIGSANEPSGGPVSAAGGDWGDCEQVVRGGAPQKLRKWRLEKDRRVRKSRRRDRRGGNVEGGNGHS